jgi:hypothetical protein
MADFRWTAGQVRLLPGEPQAFANDPHEGVMYDLRYRLFLIAGLAKRRVQVDTGFLLTTIRDEVNSNVRRYPYGDVIAGKGGRRKKGGDPRTVPEIMDRGSRPHVIRARRRKALRFVVNGKVVFARTVLHPGTRGSGFLTRSLYDGGGI